MNQVIIATSEDDARAAEAVVRHHAELATALARQAEAVGVAAIRQDAESADAARRELVTWCEAELVPHAVAEEKALYPAAHVSREGRLLVDGMLAEHQAIIGLVSELASAEGPVPAAAAARALQALFDSHLAKENDQVLPLLAASTEVSMADLLAGMHELLGGQPRDESACGDRANPHNCTCGEKDGPGYPELDARAIPHAIRHATIFGALDSLPTGGGVVLVAPHDPARLLAQVEQRYPGGMFAVNYLERGPDAWRLAFVRTDRSALGKENAGADDV